MKVLLLKDVYKLGQAGDVKKVADGYGRNYLIPQGMAVLATGSTIKQVDRLREQAAIHRQHLNQELGSTAEALDQMTINFPVRASEQGRLYGSVTTQTIVNQISETSGIKVDRRLVLHQAIRQIGAYQIPIRLTADLIPEITVLVHREGEAPESVLEVEEVEEAEEVEAVEAVEAEEATEAETTEAEADEAE